MYQVLDCTRFCFTSFFVFFEMYQVSKYQVFQKSTRLKLPGWRKYQVKSTSTGTFLYKLVKKKTYGPVRTVASLARTVLKPLSFLAGTL